MDRRRAAGALLALAACIACTSAAPTASNQTALDLYESDSSEGCYYNFQHYGEGDRIMTNEPCLNCTCHNRMLMCYLRVCPFTKAIGQDCTVEKRADQCCPIVTCPDVPVDLLTSTSTTSTAEYGATGLGHLDRYGCSINGKYFPEGAKVPPSPNKPCEHCYCIRNMTTCVMQECTLHVDGCTPIYHKEVCCPVRYSCDHPEDEILLLDDMTTTVRPTPGFLLTTTTMPSVTQIPLECVHNDQIFPDGALIKTEKACDHCYCMKGDIVCVVQECGTPMENEGKNCTSLAPKEGQCCPDTYICEGDNELQTDDTTTLIPPRRAGVEGSGYRNEDEYTVQPTIFEPEMEGSGLEGTGLEGSEQEGSGDEENTEKPLSTRDDNIAPGGTTTVVPPKKLEDDNLATTEISPVFIPASTEPPSFDSGKYTTEPDKGQNTVPSEEQTTVPSVRETTISNVDMHKTEPSDEETTSAAEQKTETPSDHKLATTIVPDSSLLEVTSSDIFDIKERTTLAEGIKQSEQSVTDTPEIFEPLATSTVKDEQYETQTVIPSDEKESKTTTVQLPDDTHESAETIKPHEMTTETMVELSTAKDVKQEGEDSALLTEKDKQQTTISDKFEMSETTSANPIENEIQEEVSPIASPGIIPGEGNCLVNGITYGNDSVVPSTNKCQTNCRCMSSIVKCDPIICSGPPENMINCLPIYDTTETCCPTYICDHDKETIPPQPHSQMAGTESPVTQDIECNDAECKKQGDSKSSPTPSLECSSGDCLVDKDNKDTSECETPGCGEQPSTTVSSKPEISKQPEVCLDGNCISPPESCLGDNCELPIHRDKPCETDDNCNIPLTKPCEGPDCGIEVAPCEGDACVLKPAEKPSSEVPQTECTEESCTKKEVTGVENKFEPGCKDEKCIPEAPTESSPEPVDVKTESPVPKDESSTEVKEGDKQTERPEVVTEIYETTEHKEMHVTELPFSHEIQTETPYPEEPVELDTMAPVQYSTDIPIPKPDDSISVGTEPSEGLENKFGSETPELSSTELPKVTMKELEEPSVTESEKPATKQPLPEGPATEMHDITTQASKDSSDEEHELGTEIPQLTTSYIKFDAESTVIPEKLGTSESPVTDSHSYYSEGTEAPSEEQIKPIALPDVPVKDFEESQTMMPELSKDEKQDIPESPVTEKTDGFTKASEQSEEEISVTKGQEIGTELYEQSPVTEMQEIDTKGTETPSISGPVITEHQDETTKVPELIVTEPQERTTIILDLPVQTENPETQEKTTESPEKSEYPVTHTGKVTVEPEESVLGGEKTPESIVTESQEVSSHATEVPISEKSEEELVTESDKPLQEGLATETQEHATESSKSSPTPSPEVTKDSKESEVTEAAVPQFVEKTTDTSPVFEDKEISAFTETLTKPTELPEESKPAKEQESPVTEVEKDNPTEAPISEQAHTETNSEVKRPESMSPETTKPSDGQLPCDKESGCDVPLTQPCEGLECDVDKKPSDGQLPCDKDSGCDVPLTQPCEGSECDVDKKPSDGQLPCDKDSGCDIPLSSQPCKGSECDVDKKLSDGQLPCDKDSGCDVPLTQPCEGSECDVDKKPSDGQLPCDKDSGCEVPLSPQPCEGSECFGDKKPFKDSQDCGGDNDCGSSAIPEIPAPTCEGETCKELPVSDEKQQAAVTETIEIVTEASDNKPEPVSEELAPTTPETAQEQLTEIPATESGEPLREGSVTELQEFGTSEIPTAAPEPSITKLQDDNTESPETSILDNQPEKPTTELEEKVPESTESDVTKSSEKETDVTEAPVSVPEPQTKATEIPEKYDIPEQPVTKYIEKATEIPETLSSGQDTEKDSQAAVTESAEEATEGSKLPVTDKTQEFTKSTDSESEEIATDKPLREGSITEPQDLGQEYLTYAPESSTAAPESPTAAPVSQTAAPESPIATPETPTGAPKSQTGAPESPTVALESPTAAPESPTTAYESPTAAPELPIVTPELATAAPESTITDSELPTAADELPTATPESQTAAPESPTTAPESPTAAPESPTAAPESPTAAPKSPTAAPESPTAASESPTVAPESQTTAPESQTAAPESPTTAPESLTTAPETPTATPESPTIAPESSTAAPESPTATPESPTIAPESPTIAPELATAAPESPTAAPESQTAAPESQTAAPESPIATPEFVTAAPEAPTAADELPTAAPESLTAAPESPTISPESPITEQGTVAADFEPTESIVFDDKQHTPKPPVIESQEKVTESSQGPKQPATEQQEMATKVPIIPEEQQTPEAPLSETQESSSKLPEKSTDNQDVESNKPATESYDLTTKMPDKATSGEHDITKEDNDVSVVTVTESHKLTTKSQEAQIPTEYPQTTISAEKERTKSPATETKEQTTNVPITDFKEEIPVTESVETSPEISVTESQEKENLQPEITEKSEAPEIQEMVTQVPETQEKITESPEKLGEYPATESVDKATSASEEPLPIDSEKLTESPVSEGQEKVTTAPEAPISEKEPEISSATETNKPLQEDLATEAQESATNAPEVPTIVPDMPKQPLSESELTDSDKPATESGEKAPTNTDVPEFEEESKIPETQEHATKTTEMPVTEFQEKTTVQPLQEKPQVTTAEEKTTESPEMPVPSGTPITEYQDKITEIPEIQEPEQTPVPETKDKATDDTKTPFSGGEQESPVTKTKEQTTEPSEAPISHQETDMAEAPVTEPQEKRTESPETAEVTVENQESPQELVTKAPDASITEEPKQEYSETTPYLVELEEHTHKIEEEASTISSEDVTTARDDEKMSEETEKPLFRPDLETFPAAPATEPAPTELPDTKFGEPSEEEELQKATSKVPERTGEMEETQTSPSEIDVPIKTETYTSAPSTEKPFESSSPLEPTTPERELFPSTTTTPKLKEEATTAESFTKPKPTEEIYASEVPKPTTTGQLSDDLPLPEDEAGQFPSGGSTGYGQEPDYVEEDQDQAFGPGTCRYGGKVYVSAQQIPRDDPCDFCFCFRSDIICLQQSCPPPIHGCHEEPISGFCCPRYECPVSMATTLNVTTTTTTTTTTLPPHFLPHAYKGQAQRRGCQIKGHTYKVGEVVRASSGPCLHCTCGGDGQMKCDPKQCTPEPMLRQMIAAAVSSKRRR